MCVKRLYLLPIDCYIPFAIYLNSYIPFLVSSIASLSLPLAVHLRKLVVDFLCSHILKFLLIQAAFRDKMKLFFEDTINRKICGEIPSLHFSISFPYSMKKNNMTQFMTQNEPLIFPAASFCKLRIVINLLVVSSKCRHCLALNQREMQC